LESRIIASHQADARRRGVKRSSRGSSGGDGI
jgi:CHRD domain